MAWKLRENISKKIPKSKRMHVFSEFGIMAKIVFVSDCHLGRRYDFLRDSVTGISERALDFLRALEYAVHHAIEIGAEYFVIAGDLYDNPRVGPTMRKLVADRILKPLSKADLKLILIGGNHDSPQSLAKGAAYGDIVFLNNASVARTLNQAIFVPKDGYSIGFVLLPYMTPRQIIGMLEEQTGQKIALDDWLQISQHAIREAIHQEVENLHTDVKILVGHFYVSGSRLREMRHPEVLIGSEFEIRMDMLPLNQLNLAIFGHVHLHQALGDGKIVVPGALERVNFDERNDEKGFIVYDTSTSKWEFVSSNPRPLYKVNASINETDDPNEAIQAALQEQAPNFSKAYIRLEITSSPAMRQQINERRLRKTIMDNGAFHVEIRWNHLAAISAEPLGADLTLDPLSLFQEYCDLVEDIQNHPLRESIQALGTRFLQNRLTEED
ncbi:MAG: metallophosphoesterase family protein [Candidatus Hodarchaeales archaeon]